MSVEQKNEILWKGRGDLSVQGVKELLRFDENAAEFMTLQGVLSVSGEGIRVSDLDLERGAVTICADSIDVLEYLDRNNAAAVGGWKRLFSRT